MIHAYMNVETLQKKHITCVMLNDLALSLAFNEDIIIGITLTYKFEFMAFCEKFCFETSKSV